MEEINKYTVITPQLVKLSRLCTETGKIDPDLYTKHNVKRGLRDLNGKGVLAGLTEISEVKGCNHDENGNSIPCEGQLFYRGYNIADIVRGFTSENRFGFEEVIYLLLFGRLPSKNELSEFEQLLAFYRSLPPNFVRDIIMKAPSRDLMNSLSRSVLTMYSYDEHADDTSITNVLRQCLQLIALFSVLSVYSYQVFSHYTEGNSLIIHNPNPKLSTAENILYTLRPDSKYTALEAKLLDLSLVLHAEHGGGNNSTFTTHVVTSSGTDTYSAISAALCSLKGPKHGGANIKVVKMFEDMKEKIHDYRDDDEIKNYLHRILNKEEFDHSGLIYGVGHAVYSLSDPRAVIFKGFVKKLSQEKGCLNDFMLYDAVERLAPIVIAEERRIFKGISANVDFYSGFVYKMLGLPLEMYTPLFAIARIAGWSAHRLEELINPSKIIRPAYKSIHDREKYIPINERQ